MSFMLDHLTATAGSPAQPKFHQMDTLVWLSLENSDVAMLVTRPTRGTQSIETNEFNQRCQIGP